MDRAVLEEILTDLRARRSDHQTVEAKRGLDGLPSTLHETLSAFTNRDEGGIYIQGVDEGDGGFAITGLADPAKTYQDFSSLCGQMAEPIRGAIDLVEIDGRFVLVAEIPPTQRDKRPNYLRSKGPYAGSFIRVGDGDQQLTRGEVDEMLAERSTTADLSARRAPGEAELEQAAVTTFVERIRATRAIDSSPEEIQRQFGVIADGHPTLAGALTLGDLPERVLPAARIAYRVLPSDTAPADARYSATHLEGTIGQLLDQAMTAFGRDLRTFQVVRDDGNVQDELDVPREALREIVSNALMHRSFTEFQETRTILIEISDSAVVITSPGGLHIGADIAKLGIDSIPSVRNLALVRIGEQVETPAGVRILENQASGIANADKASNRAGTMPALFIDRPDTFQVVLLRGSLTTTAADELLGKRSDRRQFDALRRLITVAVALEEANERFPGLPSLALDARLAARALAPSTPEDAAALLRQLEDEKILERRLTRHVPSWRLRATSSRPRKAQSRIPDLLAAIADSDTGRLRSSEIGTAMGLRSTNSTGNWINRALRDDLIETLSQNPTDPTRAYSLTAKGKKMLESIRRTS